VGTGLRVGVQLAYGVHRTRVYMSNAWAVGTKGVAIPEFGYS
jgi:hypothetical protein